METAQNFITKAPLQNNSMVKISSYFKRFTLAMLTFLVLASVSLVAKAQTLGTYSNTSIIAGKNTTVTPSAAPTGTTSAVAYTHSSFTGVLTVNPTTGVVTVTDAKQAGTYTITVKAFGTGTATQTFTLTVTDTECSQGTFTGSTSLSVGNNPQSVAIGDFNGDGKQDLAIANTGSHNVSIRLGDGNGGFSGSAIISVGVYPVFIVIGDFNGDGKQDFATADAGSNFVSIRLGMEVVDFQAVPI